MRDASNNRNRKKTKLISDIRKVIEEIDAAKTSGQKLQSLTSFLNDSNRSDVNSFYNSIKLDFSDFRFDRDEANER